MHSSPKTTRRDVSVVVKIQHHKTPAEWNQQLKGMRVTMRTHISARLHRNGQTLYGVAQLRMKIAVGT
jgi:hypothetical protein